MCASGRQSRNLCCTLRRTVLWSLWRLHSRPSWWRNYCWYQFCWCDLSIRRISCGKICLEIFETFLKFHNTGRVASNLDTGCSTAILKVRGVCLLPKMTITHLTECRLNFQNGVLIVITAYVWFVSKIWFLKNCQLDI